MITNFKLDSGDIKAFIDALDIAIDAYHSQINSVNYKSIKKVSVMNKIPFELQNEFEIEDKIQKLIKIKNLFNDILEKREKSISSLANDKDNDFNMMMGQYLRTVAEMYDISVYLDECQELKKIKGGSKNEEK